MIEVTAAIIREGEKILICQRPKGKNCELLWEFPGGKIEPGESGEQCIVRECQEELDVTVKPLKKVFDVTSAYTDRTIHLQFYECEILKSVPAAKEHQVICWVTKAELDRYSFCPADQKMIEGYFYDSVSDEGNIRTISFENAAGYAE